VALKTPDVASLLQYPAVNKPHYNLAIETSSRHGSIALGCGDDLLETVDLPEQRRHAIELLPRIDQLCQSHGVRATDLAAIYVSVGPGSFTGLRIGITTAKTLGQVTGCDLFAVPTLDVVIENAPEEHPHVAVMLNAKRGQCFTGLYRRAEGRWHRLLEPTLMTPAQLCDEASAPPAIIGDHLPEYDWPDGSTVLPSRLATPRSEVVWRLGRTLAGQTQPIGPAELVPLYVRLPEAEEKWQAHQSSSSPARGSG
jgi:tRNA threonylcarbamoyladenosine biosynthesis protein TsaB